MTRTSDEHEAESQPEHGVGDFPTEPVGSADAVPEAERVRATERERLRALVAADMDVAERLHAADFELITPGGAVLSREQYLGWVASGEIDYRVWEPDSSIEARLYDGVALLRYQSRLEMFRGGRHWGPSRCWHTDTYEQRDGRWQCVWSHATEIQ